MRILCVVTIIVLTKKYLFAEIHTRPIQNHKTLNFTDMAKKYGYSVEEYEIETEDGYFLKLFRIPGNRECPILLMHGVLDSSDTWVLRGRSSLGITLADRGYDTWFGNVRGNKYSRRHRNLDPDKDASFWDFTFHEHGHYDLPAMIDKVLALTGAGKLNAIGHSQGNTDFYVLGSTRPKYNDKINVMIALAPICYLHHLPPPLSLIIPFSSEIYAYSKSIGLNEVYGQSTATGKLVDLICNILFTKYPVCAFGVIFPVTGFDIEQMSPQFYNIAINHYPDSTSMKNLYHLAQMARRGRFSRFDHGSYKNLKEYNSIIPPDYDLKKVSMPIELIAGMNDHLSVLADVDILRAQLPNVENYIILDRKVMNHLDFVWGKNMKDYLFPYIFSILEKEKADVKEDDYNEGNYDDDGDDNDDGDGFVQDYRSDW